MSSAPASNTFEDLKYLLNSVVLSSWNGLLWCGRDMKSGLAAPVSAFCKHQLPMIPGITLPMLVLIALIISRNSADVVRFRTFAAVAASTVMLMGVSSCQPTL